MQHGIIFLAQIKGKLNSEAVCLNFCDQAVNKNGASKSQYQGLRANNLLRWKAIDHFASKDGNLSFWQDWPETHWIEAV